MNICVRETYWNRSLGVDEGREEQLSRIGVTQWELLDRASPCSRKLRPAWFLHDLPADATQKTWEDFGFDSTNTSTDLDSYIQVCELHHKYPATAAASYPSGELDMSHAKS
jgi:hypothetical protein